MVSGGCLIVQIKNNMDTITIGTIVRSTIKKVWDMWTDPRHVQNWNHLSRDWGFPFSKNDTPSGGPFVFNNSLEEDSPGFNYTRTYTEIILYEKLAYTVDNGWKVVVTFIEKGDEIYITQTLEIDPTSSKEISMEAWHGLLANFKNYVETH